MLYFSILKKEPDTSSELWIRTNKGEYPIFDYKIENDQIKLISDQAAPSAIGVTLDELIKYVQEEGAERLVPYTIVDEQTGNYLDIKDRFSNRIIFEICN